MSPNFNNKLKTFSAYPHPMESENFYRIILLDFGHPMNSSTVKNIIDSLENILALTLTFSQDANQINFGILVLDSEFKIFYSEFKSRKNYDLIIKNLRTTSKAINTKVTVQEYKYLILNSIEMVLCELQGKETRNNNIKSSNFLIQFAIVTKKSASILVDIVTDVTNKLQKTFSNIPLFESFKIVQITSVEEQNTNKSLIKSTSINLTFCSDNVNDLNYFFKDWLLNPQKELRILLSCDLKLEIKCDVYDCTVNPIAFIGDRKFDVFNDIPFKSLNRLLGVLKTVKNLEIINRLLINRFCPTLIFGIPRQLYATRSNSLSGTDLQINLKLFKELCRELNRTGQGLLAKSVIPTGNSELLSFHLLTSDGDILLMNDVAPDELYLPKIIRHAYVNSHDEERVVSMIKSCFQKIQFLDEYNPENFSSRIYEHLKNNLIQYSPSEPSKGFFEHFDSNGKMVRKAKTKKRNLKKFLNVAALINDNENFSKEREKQKKKSKQSSDKEPKNIHPALLSLSIVKKYRKVPSNAFNLSELSDEYNDSIM